MPQINELVGRYKKEYPFGNMYCNETLEEIAERSKGTFKQILNMEVQITEGNRDGSYSLEEHMLEEEIDNIISELSRNSFDSISQKGHDYQIGKINSEITTSIYRNRINNKITIVVRDNGLGKFAYNSSQKNKGNKFQTYGGMGLGIQYILKVQLVEKFEMVLGETGAVTKIVINPHRAEFDWEELKSRKVRKRFQ